MKAAGLRCACALVLFAAWIGWLAYLVYGMKSSLPAGSTRPVVLSRPQFLISSLDVIAHLAEVDKDPAEVLVREVSWPRDEQAQALVGQKVRVSRLPECRDDWNGAGEYILPLMPFGEKGYQVAPLPRSPGFPSGRPRIYLVTPPAREQLHALSKPTALVVPK